MADLERGDAVTIRIESPEAGDAVAGKPWHREFKGLVGATHDRLRRSRHTIVRRVELIRRTCAGGEAIGE